MLSDATLSNDTSTSRIPPLLIAIVLTRVGSPNPHRRHVDVPRDDCIAEYVCGYSSDSLISDSTCDVVDAPLAFSSCGLPSSWGLVEALRDVGRPLIALRFD